jgi:hypothetical protein
MASLSSLFSLGGFRTLGDAAQDLASEVLPESIPGPEQDERQKLCRMVEHPVG